MLLDRIFKQISNILQNWVDNRATVYTVYQALFILKNSLSLPKLLYVLRCAECWKFPEKFEAFDQHIKITLEKVTNIPMSPDVWKQATLPIAMGKLGLQKAADTALPAYVSSLISAMPTVESIVPESRLSDKVVELSLSWKTPT